VEVSDISAISEMQQYDILYCPLGEIHLRLRCCIHKWSSLLLVRAQTSNRDICMSRPDECMYHVQLQHSHCPLILILTPLHKVSCFREAGWCIVSLCSRLKTVVSSENLKVLGRPFVHSFVKSVKRIGELTQPCGMSVLRDPDSDRVNSDVTFSLVKRE